MAVRFWSKVDRDAVGCWPFRGGRFHFGHGRFSRGGRPAYAHRVAWELTHGPVPDGLCVLHACDNPPCCNPSHLFLGTRDDNNKDAAAKGRLTVPHPRRHVVSDADCDRMVALVRAGMRQSAAALQFGVSQTFVSLMVRGERRQLRQPAALREAV